MGRSSHRLIAVLMIESARAARSCGVHRNCARTVAVRRNVGTSDDTRVLDWRWHDVGGVWSHREVLRNEWHGNVVVWNRATMVASICLVIPNLNHSLNMARHMLV